MIHQVAYSHADPWSRLVALKQPLKPSNQSRALLVEKRYHQLSDYNTHALSKTDQIFSDEPDLMQLTMKPPAMLDTTIFDI